MSSTVTPPDHSKVGESSELDEYLRTHAKLVRMPEREFRAKLIKEHGSLETAMKLMKVTFAENEAAIEKAFPPGQRPRQAGVSPQRSPLHPTFYMLSSVSHWMVKRSSLRYWTTTWRSVSGMGI
jgi:hypothetical protein